MTEEIAARRAAQLWAEGWRLRGERWVAPVGFRPHRHVRWDVLAAYNAREEQQRKPSVAREDDYQRRLALAISMISAGQIVSHVSSETGFSPGAVRHLARRSGLRLAIGPPGRRPQT